jgi:membrane associated rhomboid family serine protease
MAECNKCGDEISMPYKCNRCGNKFCSDHRLPEKHSCTMLDRGGADSEIVVEENRRDEDDSVVDKIKEFFSSSLTNDFWKKVDGDMTKYIGVTFVAVYILQILTLTIFNSDSVHNSLFVFSPENVTYIWTWFTSIFAHSPFGIWHIIGNGIVLIFFGRLLEKIIGSKRFTGLFLLSGLVAGISQVALGIIINEPTGVLGASGALMGVMGVLAIYKPRMKVYLYFFIPVPLWALTIGFAGVSVFATLSGGMVLGGVAHVAHLAGLIIGLVYGYRTKDDYNVSGNMKLSRQMR